MPYQLGEMQNVYPKEALEREELFQQVQEQEGLKQQK
jgi:hypothetical protein